MEIYPWRQNKYVQFGSRTNRPFMRGADTSKVFVFFVVRACIQWRRILERVQDQFLLQYDCLLLVFFPVI
jgi:hypothetical protein